ncbi:metallophosphoesterase [candidate division KSB1 bacterium]|nr:metallophosphoesterase [candidate division KSB1 bacterium]
MRLIKQFVFILILIILPVILIAQFVEVEPNNSIAQANLLTLTDSSRIRAEFNPAGDVDYFVMHWQKNCMYYLTSIESGTDISPNIEIYLNGNSNSILKSDVGGRNGNNNFRLSGYVPETTNSYYAKVFNENDTQGLYTVRFAGGRNQTQLAVHEPDNTVRTASQLNYLTEADTIYGAIYPANDIDYYKIHGTVGYKFTIGTCPIFDLEIRDTDTFIALHDGWGSNILENDDIGTITTPSGNTNCTFSRMTGIFAYTGDYYISVRSYYNEDFGQTINENRPPMGEYGIYFIQEQPGVFSRYPHIEIPTTNSVLVQWNTSIPQPTYLRWGNEETCVNIIQKPELVNDHLVKIDSLLPESKYYYRVIASNDSSDCEYFYTVKPEETKQVNFFIIGDSSPYTGFGSSPEQIEIARQILKTNYDFGLHAGDINQHHGEEYDLVFYEPYRDILKSAPIFPCIGNHDSIYDSARTYLASFNLPHNNPDSTERYYSFNYGNAHFISLDTNSPYNPDSPQYTWLVNDLKSEMRNNTLWTFVLFHKPPWSEGWPDYPGELDVREHLVPIFEQFNVDMTFSGHTHDYERGFINEIYYIITGGGGCTLEEGIHAYDYEHVTVWINQHHFTYVQLKDNVLELKAINIDGEVIDEFVVEKITSDMNESLLQQSQQPLPATYCLHQNFPNPFNSTTQIRFDVKKQTRLNLTIHNIEGRTVKSLVNGLVEPGRHQMEWKGMNDSGEIVSSGVYLIKFQTPQFKQIQRIVILK